jgi:hypothetical protein
MGDPQPENFVATRLFDDELVEADLRAAAAGLSRAGYLRALLLADGDACAALRAAIAERDESIAERDELIARLEEEARLRTRDFGMRVAALESQLERARLHAARADGWERSDELERRRQARELFYG